MLTVFYHRPLVVEGPALEGNTKKVSELNLCVQVYTFILSLNVLSIETDLDVKLELKTVMDKIRTLSMGKNKEITVSQLILRLHSESVNS